MWWRLRQPAVRVNARVISVGNLTAGGTGKTPAAIHLAQDLVRNGARVAVVTRGYGSAKTAEPLLLAPGDAAVDIAARFGDEPALIRHRVPEIVLVKSADRVRGAQAAVREHGCTHVILDDGFQSVRLARDEDIVLIDATNPFGGRQLLPRGILREPLTALGRATAIWLTRCDGAAETAALEAEIRRFAPGVPIRRTCHRPTGFWELNGGAAHGLDWIRGQELRLLSGIGNPAAFRATVERLGAHVVEHVARRDHGATAADLPREGVVITTEKDALRLGAVRPGVYALRVELAEMR